MSGAHTALLREPRTNSNAKGSARSSSLGYKQLPGGSGQTPGGALSQRAAGETMTSSRAVPTMPRGAGGTQGISPGEDVSAALQVRGGVGAPRILGPHASHKDLGQRSEPGMEGVHVPRCSYLCSQRKLKSYCQISWRELTPFPETFPAAPCLPAWSVCSS